MQEFKCEDLLHQPPLIKKQNYDEKNNVKYGSDCCYIGVL